MPDSEAQSKGVRVERANLTAQKWPNHWRQTLWLSLRSWIEEICLVARHDQPAQLAKAQLDARRRQLRDRSLQISPRPIFSSMLKHQWVAFSMNLLRLSLREPLWRNTNFKLNKLSSKEAETFRAKTKKSSLWRSLRRSKLRRFLRVPFQGPPLRAKRRRISTSMTSIHVCFTMKMTQLDTGQTPLKCTTCQSQSRASISTSVSIWFPFQVRASDVVPWRNWWGT